MRVDVGERKFRSHRHGQLDQLGFGMGFGTRGFPRYG